MIGRTRRLAGFVLLMGAIHLLAPEPVEAFAVCTVCVDPSCPSLTLQNQMCASGNCGPSMDDCGNPGARCDGWDREFHCQYDQR